MGRMDKERATSIARLVVAFVALINQILALTGENPIPYSDTDIGNFVSGALTVAATLWVWWKDNVMTEGASIGHRVTKNEKLIRKINNIPPYEKPLQEQKEPSQPVQLSQPVNTVKNESNGFRTLTSDEAMNMLPKADGNGVQ